MLFPLSLRSPRSSCQRLCIPQAELEVSEDPADHEAGRWWHQHDLDKFLASIYGLYDAKGFGACCDCAVTVTLRLCCDCAATVLRLFVGPGPPARLCT